MATIIEGGRFEGYDSNIPIEMIQNYIKQKYSYNGCGTSYGKNSANMSFSFEEKEYFRFNENFSLLKPFFWFKEPPFGYFKKSVNKQHLLEKVEKFLFKKGYTNIYCEFKKGNFCFKILTEQEKKLKEIQKNVENF